MVQHSQLFLYFNATCVAVAYFMLALALYWMPVDFATMGYVGMGIVFLSGSLVTLVKTIRDMQDAERLTSKLEAARHEKLLNEYVSEGEERAL